MCVCVCQLILRTCTYHVEENFRMIVQTFMVFTDDPTTQKNTKSLKILTAQLVLYYARLCRQNKNCENFFVPFSREFTLAKIPVAR